MDFFLKKKNVQNKIWNQKKSNINLVPVPYQSLIVELCITLRFRANVRFLNFPKIYDWNEK